MQPRIMNHHPLTIIPSPTLSDNSPKISTNLYKFLQKPPTVSENASHSLNVFECRYGVYRKHDIIEYQNKGYRNLTHLLHRLYFTNFHLNQLLNFIQRDGFSCLNSHSQSQYVQYFSQYSLSALRSKLT